jgi:hypothetical protein
MGHVFSPKQVDINQLMRDPQAASSVRSAAKVMGIQIANSATEGIVKGAKEVLVAASPSKKMKEVGQDAGRGLILGVQEYIDDAKVVGQKLGAGMVQTASGLIVPGGAIAGGVRPTTPGVSLSEITERARRNREQLLATQQLKRTQAMNARMNSLNKAFMSGTFALSALSGVASMAGGNLGKFSEILFQISGPLFALSSIIQLFTGEKIVGVLKNLGKLKLGLVAVGITALSIGFKLLNSSIEKQRMAVEGLSNALTTTKDKAKFLGDFFGIVPSARAGSQTVLGAAQTRPSERTKIEELKTNEEFQSKYKKDIEAFATATNEQVLLGFQTMALDLRGQGFAKEQIDIIIKSIAEEAGQTDVLLKFKTIDFDLSKEAGANYASALAKQIANDFSNALPKEIEMKGVFRQGRGGQSVKVGEELDLTPEQQAKINESGQLLSNVLTGIQGQFKAGIINAKQYNDIINKTINGITNNANAQLLFQSALEKTNPEIAKVTKGITDINELSLIYQATLVGFTPKLQGLFAALSGGSLFERAGTIQAIKNELLAGEKLMEELYGFDRKDGDGGALNALQERIKGIQDQTESFILLRDAKIDEATATELSNDAEIASLILKNKSSKLLPKIIANIKEYSNALKAQKDAEKNFADPSTVFKNELERLQKVANFREKLIDIDFSSKIKKENNALKNQEKQLENINIQIEQITKSQIDPIRAIIDSNNFALEKIALEEDAINEKYNKQIEALEKISTINQDIANTQKQRLSIADALTRGDISAAAQLVQEARAEQAQSAVSKQKEGLNANRDAALTALGRNAIEKQNKELQLQISTIESTKLKTLQSQKQTIEDGITLTTRNITALNEEVRVLKEGLDYSGKTKENIDDLAELIQLATAAGIEFDAVLLSQARNAASLASALKDAANVKGISSSDSIKNTQIPNVAKNAGLVFGAGMSRMYGGMIPKYLARGGRVGSDTVPAMLTPGEFVMNRKATEQFGPILSMLNESKYPSMIGNKGIPQIPINNISTSANDNSTAVYNYNLGFSINGANSNANDIARAVMKEIKNVNSQKVRGQRQ